MIESDDEGNIEIFKLLFEDFNIALMIESDDEGNIEIFKKQLESLSVDQLAAATIRFKWQYEWKDVSLVQYLASQTAKFEQLELLLNHGLDPRAVTEDIDYTPLEIAACKENTKAFDLLAPHYEESIKKKIAQLFIWGLTDKAPSAAFMLLFESVPLAE